MLTSAIDSYLDLRRALGYKLEETERMLRNFERYTASMGQPHITAFSALAWVDQTASAPQRAKRLTVIVGFARFLHAEDPRHQIPQRTLICPPTFVRLHRIDENVSGEVAPLLAFLRELQRRHAIAVLVVHHAKKGAGRVRAGQALRGSSEFHAWGDCNLYLKKQGDDTVSLTVEHRAAPSIRPLTLELATNRLGVALRVVERAAASVEPPSSVDERIITALTASQRPLSFPELRGLCRTRSTTVYERLAALTAIGRVSKSPKGYRLAAAANGRSSDKS